MKVSIICFSKKGEDCASLLEEGLLKEKLRNKALSVSVSRAGKTDSLNSWTRDHFRDDGLIFIGACGIAVRAIAPYVRDKQSDPAVVCIDETKAFAVPILSGHLGGANDLAALAARILGAVCVITTATDRRRVFAVDEWAGKNSCVIRNPKKIKSISSRLLDGKEVTLYSDVPTEGELPNGIRLTDQRKAADVIVTVSDNDEDPPGLRIIPRTVTVGLGCKAGVSAEEIRAAADGILFKAGFAEESLLQIASIDLKKEEPGLLAYCKEKKIPLVCFSAEELERIEGFFTDSKFVKTVTGVGNVCERAAVCASGGRLIVSKTVFGKVTAACAVEMKTLKWESEKWD